MLKKIIAWIKGFFVKDKTPAPLPVIRDTVPTDRPITCFKCGALYITLRKIMVKQGKKVEKIYICQRCLDKYKGGS